MTETDLQKVREALDILALALVEHEHKWSIEERYKYTRAQAALKHYEKEAA